MGWPNDMHLQSALNNSLNHQILRHLLKSSIVFEAYFVINLVTLSILTVIESCITIRLTDDILIQRTNRVKELTSIAVTNIVCGLFGLPPVSLPVSMNIMVIKLKASTQVYNLMAAGFLLVSVWILPWLFAYVPMILVTVFNISLGLMMFDIAVIKHYFRHNHAYILPLLLIIVASFFIHIVFSMLIAWVAFFTLYLSGAPKESFRIVKRTEFKESFKMTFYRSFLNLVPSIKEADKQVSSSAEVKYDANTESLIKLIYERGIIYQLRGRFNFTFFGCHVENINQLKIMHKTEGPVVIDFSEVWNADRDFIEYYDNFLEELRMNTRDLYIIGVPEKFVVENCLGSITWIDQFNEEGRFLYSNNFEVQKYK